MIYLIKRIPLDNDYDEEVVFASTTKPKAEDKIKEFEEKQKLILDLMGSINAQWKQLEQENPAPVKPTSEEKTDYEKLTGKSPLIWLEGTWAPKHILDIEYESKVCFRRKEVSERVDNKYRELEEKYFLPQYGIQNWDESKYIISEIESD